MSMSVSQRLSKLLHHLVGLKRTKAGLRPAAVAFQLVDKSGVHTWGISTNGVAGYEDAAPVAVGGTVTQATSKSTGVTLSKASGQITLHAANLADVTTVTFTVTNTLCTAKTLALVNHISGGTLGSYVVQAHTFAAGSFKISVRNVSGGTLGEALVLGFNLQTGANS